MLERWGHEASGDLQTLDPSPSFATDKHGCHNLQNMDEEGIEDPARKPMELASFRRVRTDHSVVACHFLLERRSVVVSTCQERMDEI